MKMKLAFILLTLLLLCGTNGWASVTGQCSDCHTMHNSQDGSTVVTDLGRSLTKGDCVGCHTGDNQTWAADGRIPYVDNPNAEYGPDYDGSGALINATATNTLAGGSFSNKTGHDNYVHNVVGISSSDATIGETPPGWIASTFYADDGSGAPIGNINGGGTTWSTQLTCAGTNGCHGSHTNADDFADIRGSHHGDDSTIDGTTVARSYRFLRGILGFEDPDWELSVSSSNHNQYYGVDRTTTATGSMNTQTISYLCAECHGLFHSNDNATTGRGIIHNGPTIDNANPWLRHPTDFALKSTDANSEYLSYADASGTLASSPGTSATYNYIAPLASASADTITATIDDPFSGTDNDIVTCLSCHRAHGSAHPDLLRWDYTAMVAAPTATTGFENKGCFACHTSKD